MNKYKYVQLSLNDQKEVIEKVISEHSVLAENDRFLVLDDYYFTKLEKRKDKHQLYTTPDVVHISEEKGETMKKLFGTFRLYIYSTASLKVIENKINREFNKWLQDKVGLYGTTSTIRIKLDE